MAYTVTSAPMNSVHAMCAAMNVGDIGRIIYAPMDSMRDKHLLRTYTGFVLLEDPSRTWIFNSGDKADAAPSFRVAILPPKSKLVLEVI